MAIIPSHAGAPLRWPVIWLYVFTRPDRRGSL